MKQALRALCAALQLSTVPAALADVVVPGEPRRFVVGDARGAASVTGISLARDRRTSLPPPRSPRVARSVHVEGGVTCEMLADDDGRVIVAGVGTSTELTPEGKIERRSSHGVGQARHLALLNDGTRVVLTDEPRLAAWSPGGAPRFSLRPAHASTTVGGLLPLWDGGVLVLLGSSVHAYSAAGELRRRLELPERAQTALRNGEELVVVGARGGVYRWRGHGELELELVASVPSPVLDAALVGHGTLVTLSSNDSLVHVDLARRRAEPLSGGPGAPGSRWALLEDMLLGSAGGRLIVLRADPSRVPPLRELLARAGFEASWLSSATGSAALAAPAEPLRVLHDDGGVREVGDVRCDDPISLIPTGPRRLALACRSGRVWLIEDASDRTAGSGHGPPSAPP